MSEKYDGVRAYWDGVEFYTLYGRVIVVPESVIKKMPPVALDGELW